MEQKHKQTKQLEVQYFRAVVARLAAGVSGLGAVVVLTHPETREQGLDATGNMQHMHIYSAYSVTCVLGVKKRDKRSTINTHVFR
jgi:hypothetical protein